MGIQSTKLQVCLGADYKKCKKLSQNIEPGKIKIASVHDIKGAWFWDQIIKNVHVMDLSVGNFDERGQIST